MTSIYVIGSLRNKNVPEFAQTLRLEGFDVFDDWFAPGPEADDFWQKYSNGREQDYAEALKSHAAQHVFEFDKKHLDRCDLAILLMPGGKSAHLELGYTIGRGKPGYIFFPDGEPERYDVMYNFATGVFFDINKLIRELKANATIAADVNKALKEWNRMLGDRKNAI
jgi:nucleoside 2-deoxyribosyltransferase